MHSSLIGWKKYYRKPGPSHIARYLTAISIVNSMETSFASAVRGYHVYRDVWKPSIGEKLVAKWEFNNPMDKHAVKVVKGDETVSHLPREFSQIAWYFLGRSGEISVEVIGRRRHCKQLCGGMEIPCQLEFNCSSKEQMKRLKELLASKIQV